MHWLGVREWIEGQGQGQGRYSHHAGRGWRREAARTEGPGAAPRGEGMELSLRRSEEWVSGRKETRCGIWGC